MNYPPDCAPRADCTAKRFPVFPRPGSIKRVEIEELIGEFSFRQDILLDSASCTHEKGIDLSGQCLHRAGDCQTGIEMTASPASCEEDAHLCAA